MSDTLTRNTADLLRSTPRPRPTRYTRPDIILPNGKKLRPRVRIAEDAGVCEKTLARMNLPTIYWGGVAYGDPDDMLKEIGDSLKRKNQPHKRRRV
jgi:hypothetical protein